jgi:hypothetical protein
MKAKSLTNDEAQAVLMQKDAKPSAQLDPNTQAMLEKMRAASQNIAKEKPKPLDVRIVPDQDDDGLKTIELKDGRVIVMGPPGVPHMLVIPEMFKDQKEDGLVLRSNMLFAKVFQYVRSIDGQPLGKCIRTWAEIVDLMHQLGDLGCCAVEDNYEIWWGTGVGNYWNIVEKKPQTGTSEK